MRESRITATDDSSINATAGSAALQAAMGQNMSAAVGLGFSLTINDIDNTALAAIEDSTVDVGQHAGGDGSKRGR